MAQAILPPAQQAPFKSWRASLQLTYRHQLGRTLSHHRHEGPLRVLQSLYPEGDAICHQVLVHPPGGLAGGDQMDIEAVVEPQAHALVTTPGATRFYRTVAGPASQRIRVTVSDGGRIEWLPLETIAYNGCQGHNQLQVKLAPDAQMMAWDVLALGLPASNMPFESGSFLQHLEVSGIWLDRGLIEASDRHLMNGPVGLAGRRCLGTLVLASGSRIDPQKLELGLEQARGILADSSCQVGVTSPHPQVLVARVLCEQTEPARAWLQKIWGIWRLTFWGLQAHPSRMWSV
jgi:urease accessory protein